MKILVLNPHIDAEHQIAKFLQNSSFTLLLTQDVEQAWQVLQLHGNTVDLAWIHREAGPGKAHDLGLSLLLKVKAEPSQADLPIVVSSEAWGETEFAQHQQTPLGANAYLRWPCQESELLKTMREVLGIEAEPATSPIVLDAPEITFGGENPSLSPAGPESSSGISIVLAELPPQTTPVSALEMPPVAEVPETFPETSPETSPETFKDEPSFSEVDRQGLAQEMPYLFERPGSRSGKPERVAVGAIPSVAAIFHPVGDAVVPGGAAQSPDTETLKKYLLLREQDVAALSSQLKSAQEQIALLEGRLREESARNTELSAVVNEQKRRIDDFEREKNVAIESLQADISEQKFQAKAKSDKARLLDAHVREATQEMERLKERVRADIRKIRVREKELENRLEIIRKDSEVLITARESKIMELKRKLDLLEFNLDLLQNQHAREKETTAELRKRLAKAAQVVRVAGGLLGASAGEALEELSAELSEHEDPNRKVS